MGIERYFLKQMFKLAAVTAVVAATSMEEMKNTAELFTIQVKEEDAAEAERRAKDAERESMKYYRMMQVSHHRKQFEAEAKALAHTDEFMALANFVEAMKKQ